MCIQTMCPDMESEQADLSFEEAYGGKVAM
jgi:hypothetical protein